MSLARAVWPHLGCCPSLGLALTWSPGASPQHNWDSGWVGNWCGQKPRCQGPGVRLPCGAGLLSGPCGSSDVNQALVRPQLWSQPDGGQGLGTICRKPLLLNSTLGPSLAPFTPEQSKADRAWLGGDGVYCFEVIGQVTHPHQEERQTPWAGPGRPGRANSCIPPLETAGAWERGRATPGRSRSSTRLLPPWEG